MKKIFRKAVAAVTAMAMALSMVPGINVYATGEVGNGAAGKKTIYVAVDEEETTKALNGQEVVGCTVDFWSKGLVFDKDKDVEVPGWNGGKAYGCIKVQDNLYKIDVTVYEELEFGGFQIVPISSEGNCIYKTTSDDAEAEALKAALLSTDNTAVWIKGNSDYKVEVTAPHTILEDDNVKVIATDLVYNGTAQEPEVIVEVGEDSLEKGTDYTVTYADNTDAGEATVTVTGIVEKTFEISQKSITGCDFDLDADVNPANSLITVKDGETVLVEDNYTVTFAKVAEDAEGEDEGQGGKIKATVEGKGNYTGTKVVYETGKTCIGDEDVVVDADSLVYDGTEKKPTVTVTVGGQGLTANTDYTVEYADNKNASENAKVIVKGTGDYRGTVTKNFTISAKDITGCDFDLDADVIPANSLVTVQDDETVLVEDTDYTVTFEEVAEGAEGEDAGQDGKIKATVTGKDNYTGTKVVYGKGKTGITDSNIEFADPSIGPDDIFYFKRTAWKLSVKVTVEDKELTKGTDYTVEYKDNINAGTATIIVTGIGDYYRGTGKKTFEIKKIELRDKNVTATVTDLVYDGNVKEAEVAVQHGEETLKLNEEYTVAYTGDRTNIGTFAVTVTGIGNYDGEVTKNFTIIAKAIEDNDVTVDAANLVYNGTAQTPAVTVEVDGTTLTEKDYDVAYDNNTNAGEATVTVTGKGNYNGEVTKNFTISAKDIEECTIALDAANPAAASTVVVSDGDKILVEGENKDYTVSYMAVDNGVSVQATVVGKRNYTGTQTVTEKVKVDIATANVEVADVDHTYTGEEQKPEVTVTIPGAEEGDEPTTLVKGTDYEVDYTDNTNVGTVTITITGKGENYKGTKTATFNITAKAIAEDDVAVTTDSFVYDGTEKKPEVVVTTGEGDEATPLTKGTDYEVTYANNTNAGTATVTVTGKGNYKGTVTKTFEIKKKSIQGFTVVLGTQEYEYDGKAKTPTVTVKDGDKELVLDTDYTVEYKDNTAVGTATVTVTGKGDYEGTADKTFKINEPQQKPDDPKPPVTQPKAISSCTVTLDKTAYTYDGKEKTPAVTVKDGTKVLKANTDYIVTYKDNTKVGTATVTITGKGNYTGTKTATFKINAAPAPVKVAQVKSLKQKTSYATTTIKLSWAKVSGATSYEVYRSTSKNKGFKKVATVKTNSLTNKKLKAGTTYYYKVCACNKSVKGAYSSTVKMVTKTATPKVTVKAGKKQIQITWKKVTGAKGYEVSLSTKKNKGFKKIKAAKASATSFTKKGLKKGQTYYVQVKAYNKNAAGKKVYSGTRTVKVKVK